MDYKEFKKIDLKTWNTLTREEKRDAILEFKEPENIYQKETFDRRIINQEKI